MHGAGRTPLHFAYCRIPEGFRAQNQNLLTERNPADGMAIWPQLHKWDRCLKRLSWASPSVGAFSLLSDEY